METKFDWPEFQHFSIKEHTILMAVGGSHSYGTNHPDSDWDYKGVLIPPREYCLSPFKNFEQTQWHGAGKTGRVSEIDGVEESDAEGVVYGLQKFMRLAANCNPNVVETLFVDDQHLVHCTPEGKLLRDNKRLFLSQRALKTFTGYAMSQLNRIKSHRAWLLSPPKKSPTREDFGLPDSKLISGDQMGAAQSFVTRNIHEFAPWLLDADNQHKAEFWTGVTKLLTILLQEAGVEYSLEADTWYQVEDFVKDSVGSYLGFSSNFVEYIRKEKQYGQAKQHYKQYAAWKKNRNPARAELEARYGYDCKHAMHLVRLLRMGEEVLLDGTMNVFRPDREELLAIRNGDWPYDQLIEWADSKVDFLYDVVRSGKAVVPKNPDQNALETLTMDVQDSFWGRSR